MAAVPLLPSLAAVIVAEPTTTPVTRPLLLTVATDVAELVHVTVRPVRVLPLASFSVAVSCSVWPTGTLAVAGLTLTVATGTLVTLMLEVPLFASLVAVIVAEPTAPPVSRPLPLTVATAAAELVHVTVRPVRVLPLASFSVAVSGSVAFVKMVADVGVTVTEATGTLRAAFDASG